MKRILAVSILCGSALAFSQQPPRKSPTVERIVKEISAKNIRTLVETLTGFDTRHTLSDTVSETRGIGASRRWIRSEFEKYAEKSNERMSVQFFESTVPPSNRVPSPTKVVNVVATLSPEPTHHAMPDRVLVISGHYDSRE